METQEKVIINNKVVEIGDSLIVYMQGYKLHVLITKIELPDGTFVEPNKLDEPF